MLIHEAVKKALEQGKKIRSKSDKSRYAIEPTNRGACLCIIHIEHNDRQSRYWNPSAEDLLADDWELCD